MRTLCRRGSLIFVSHVRFFHFQTYDKGMLAAAVDIVKDDGPGALLSGLGPTVVGYGIEGAMKVSMCMKIQLSGR